MQWLLLACLAAIAPSVLAFGSLCGRHDQLLHRHPTRGNDTVWPPPETRIAVLGDEGLTEDAQRVLQLIKDWDAHAIVHLGDYDYANSPHDFMAQLDSMIGHDIPFIAAIGNHDVVKWAGPDGYRERLIEHMKKTGIDKHCSGDYGVNMECNVLGVHIVLSGIGTYGANHSQYIESVFSNSSSAWKMCSWHKNQQMFQTGMKADETGYEVYDTCRRMGAIVATAHEHAYSRSHLMSSFENQTIASTNNQLDIEPGRSFSFVSGLGGQSVRSFYGGRQDAPWMAAAAAADNDARGGVLLCTFHARGRPDLAECTFQDIEGRTYDRFSITTAKPSPDVARKRTVAASERTCQKLIEVPMSEVSSNVTQDERVLLAPGRVYELSFPIDAKLDPARISHVHLQVMGAPDPAYSDLSTTSEPGSTLLRLALPQETRQQTPLLTDQSLLSPVLSALSESPLEALLSGASLVEQLAQTPLNSVQWGAHQNQNNNAQDETDDSWEIHEVWVSPDVSTLVTHQLATAVSSRQRQQQHEQRITIQVHTEGTPRWIYGWAQDGCLAPTLALFVDTC
ncbi:hypothetical protein RI367_001129 [Sorochytrium milnesiophthora]